MPCIQKFRNEVWSADCLTKQLPSYKPDSSHRQFQRQSPLDDSEILINGGID